MTDDEREALIRLTAAHPNHLAPAGQRVLAADIVFALRRIDEARADKERLKEDRDYLDAEITKLRALNGVEDMRAPVGTNVLDLARKTLAKCPMGHIGRCPITEVARTLRLNGDERATLAWENAINLACEILHDEGWVGQSERRIRDLAENDPR